jgi:hypothetical protein
LTGSGLLVYPAWRAGLECGNDPGDHRLYRHISARGEVSLRARAGGKPILSMRYGGT